MRWAKIKNKEEFFLIPASLYLIGAIMNRKGWKNFLGGSTREDVAAGAQKDWKKWQWN